MQTKALESNGPKIPDGGWGWVIVLSSSILCMIQDGISFSFGILFPELTLEFNASKTEASWIGALFVSMPLLTGPIMSALVDKYGCRWMTILAGILSSSGFIMSYFVQDIRVMYLTFGIISGLGLGLTFVTAVVSIAFWFEKKRNLAVGLGACGVGIGTLIYAPFTSFLLNQFGWRWSVVLLGGTLLNMCVCGALMRDPDWVIEQKKKFSNKKSTQKNVSVDEIKKLLVNGEAAEDLFKVFIDSNEENNKNGAYQSVLDLPTYLEKNEVIPEDVLKKVTTNKNIQRIIAENRRSRQSAFFKNLQFPRRSFSSSHNFKTSSCPNIQELSPESELHNKFSLKHILDLSLFLDFHFFLMSLSTIIFFAWFMTPYFFLADHMEMLGYSKSQASLVMSVMGVTSTLGMVFLGWAGDQKWCNVPKTYAGCLVLCGIFCSFQVVVSDNFYLLNAASACYGFFLASSFSFTPMIVTLLLPLNMFTKAYGLTLLCQGIGHLAGPPIAAYLFDVYQIWDYSFHLSAIWIIISGLLILVIPFTKNFRAFA